MTKKQKIYRCPRRIFTKARARELNGEEGQEQFWDEGVERKRGGRDCYCAD